MRARRAGHVINISSIGGYRRRRAGASTAPRNLPWKKLTEAIAIELKPLGIHATVVEPGFFRTDFLDARSLSTSPHAIADYSATSGAMRDHARAANHAQPGDPAKLAKAMLKLVDMTEPPLRMPFGSDTVRRIEEKNASVARELARLRDLALSTDFATAAE